MKMRNVKTITHTTFSLEPFILYIITKTVRFKYIQFSQAIITRNTSIGGPAELAVFWGVKVGSKIK